MSVMFFYQQNEYYVDKKQINEIPNKPNKTVIRFCTGPRIQQITHFLILDSSSIVSIKRVYSVSPILLELVDLNVYFYKNYVFELDNSVMYCREF